MSVEDGLQVRVYGNRQGGPGLDLPKMNTAFADMLAAHADNITATLAAVEQQCQSKARFAVRWVNSLKGGNFVLGPGVIAFAAGALDFHADGWVLPDIAGVHGNHYPRP